MHDIISWIPFAVNLLGVLQNILFQKEKTVLTKKKHCASFGCSENTVCDATTHSFPNGPKISKLLIIFVSNTCAEWDPQKHDYICSQHFTEDDYINNPIRAARNNLNSSLHKTIYSSCFLCCAQVWQNWLVVTLHRLSFINNKHVKNWNSQFSQTNLKDLAWLNKLCNNSKF